MAGQVLIVYRYLKASIALSALATTKGKSGADTGAFISRLQFFQFDFEKNFGSREAGNFPVPESTS
jgi:hypothetical protein